MGISFFILNLGSAGAEKVVYNLTLQLESSKYDKYLIVYDKNEIVYLYDAKVINFADKRKGNALANIYSHIKRIKTY